MTPEQAADMVVSKCGPLREEYQALSQEAKNKARMDNLLILSRELCKFGIYWDAALASYSLEDNFKVIDALESWINQDNPVRCSVLLSAILANEMDKAMAILIEDVK